MVLFGLCILKCFRNWDACLPFAHEYLEYGTDNYVLRAILRVLGVISRWCGFGREMQGSSAQSMYVVHPAPMGDMIKGCLESSSGPWEYLLHHLCVQKVSRTCDVVNGTKTQVIQLADSAEQWMLFPMFCQPSFYQAFDLCSSCIPQAWPHSWCRAE